MGRYRLLGPLGKGGFGAVYRAYDSELDREVALKQLERTRPDALVRFKQEFRALRELRHPNLVRMLELFESEGSWYIAMQLVEGKDFGEWVEVTRSFHGTGLDHDLPPYDERRLRQALVGMAKGLKALHVAGMVHRDLKPSNVRITPQGHAVLLDFGLVTPLESSAQSTQAGGIGTALYMAPEQALGERLGAAADWYSLGVCLYEVLAGRPPIEADSPIAVMLAKIRTDPKPPSEVSSYPVPKDLEALAMQLLVKEPTERPDADAVLAALGVAVQRMDDDPSSGGVHSSTGPLATSGVVGLHAHSLPPGLAGRDNELHFLQQAFQASQGGALRIAWVEGESGIGKSALVKESLRRLRSSDAALLVLRGRCYENEQVPYKAFDGCMDGLMRLLKRMDAAQLEALLPPKSALLAQLFPVMAAVPAIARASREGLPADPTARRLEALGVVVELLRRLAIERPLVLAIDDLQWTDQESLRLLRALVEGPHSPPALLLCTVRPAREWDPELAPGLRAAQQYGCSEVLTLKGLAEEGAARLAKQLLGAEVPESWLKAILRESQGHPLFIDALARFVTSHDVGATQALTLDAALSARIDQLDEDARQLLELLALMGRPVDWRLAEHVLEGSLEASLDRLIAMKLARRSSERDLLCYHDRIRTLVVQMLPRPERVALHRTIADALDAAGSADPAERALHWERAGEGRRAASAYEHAADSAQEVLAFDRAAQLFEAALALAPADDRALHVRLLESLGHALGKAGRGAVAAEKFEQAAALATGDRALELRVQRAHHLLTGGQIEAGERVARGVLEDLGIRMPVGEGPLLRRLVWERARLSFMPLKAPARGADEVLPAHRRHLDALRQLIFPLSYYGIPFSFVLGAYALRKALQEGDRQDVHLMLSSQLVSRNGESPHSTWVRKGRALQRELAADATDPVARAVALLADAIRVVGEGRMQRASELLEEAEKLVREQCANEPWIVGNLRAWRGQVWSLTGRHAPLAEHMEGWLAEARERQDLNIAAGLSGLGCGSVRHLMADAPDAAIEELRETARHLPANVFSLMSFGQLWGTISAELYRGGDGALRHLESQTSGLEGALIMRARPVRGGIETFRGLAALAAWCTASEAERPGLLRRVEEAIRALRHPSLASERNELPALLLEAQLAALREPPEQALVTVRAAREKLERSELYYSHPTAYLEGVLEGGEAGRRRCATVLATYEREGWKCPEKVIWTYGPALRAPKLKELAASYGQGPRVGIVGGRYEVIGALGRGGFGIVVRARDMRTGRHVALKELKRVGPTSLMRFKQEFRALQELHHPRLARLEALFEDGGSWFIGMQLVEGTDLMSWVRGMPEGPLREQRIREAFQGLVEGLEALHAGGFCHRDIKPANVRVMPEGRVVLIDFGLVGELAPETASGEEALLGTAAYVAPEQLTADHYSPASDMYAVGACLYQALAGRVPFAAASPLQTLQRKRAGQAPPLPSVVAQSQVPIAEDLETLCMRLLDPDPHARPRPSDAYLDLGGPRELRAPSVRPPPRSSDLHAGREAELALLDARFDALSESGAHLVVVSGESGIGKSTLVEQWLQRLKARRPVTLALRSRCYENEQIAYKALDAGVDGLARRLRLLEGDVCETLIPRRAAVLTELFPVLSSVRSIAEAPRKGVLSDAKQRRQQGFDALRRLLRNFSGLQPIVWVIDDLQWADVESFALLNALLASGGSTRVLFVATKRPLEEASGEVRAELSALTELPQAESIRLKPLVEDDARALAASLLGEGASQDSVTQIVAASGGHPLWITELARQRVQGLAPAGEALTLGGVLESRVRALPRGARGLLETIALLDRPHGLHVYAAALEAVDGLRGQGELDEALGVLTSEQLVRARSGQTLECSHDQVREAALAVLDEASKAPRLRTVAPVLEVEVGVDPAECARCWEGAGEAEAAARWYEQAGDAAIEVLAFGRAQTFYGRALDLAEGEDRAGQARLHDKLGQALAKDGRSARAADLFERAAELSEGEARLQLGMLAAQHQLGSGQVAKGMRAVRGLLRAVGIHLPQGNLGTLLRLLWVRAFLPLRRLKLPAPGERREAAPEVRARLNATTELSAALLWTDGLRAALVLAVCFRRALASGDHELIFSSLVGEATQRTVSAPASRGAERLRALTRAYAARLSEPRLQVLHDYSEAIFDLVCGRHVEARARLERLARAFPEDYPDQPAWLLLVRAHLARAWFFEGEHAVLARESERWLLEARSRDDRFLPAVLCGMGCAFTRHLLRDDPDAALAELQEIASYWPREPYSLVRLGEAWGSIYAELYRGGAGAWRWLEQDLEGLQDDFLTRTGAVKQSLTFFKALAVIAAWTAAGEGERALWQPRLRACIGVLERMGTPRAAQMLPLLRAQWHLLQGQREQALVEARRGRLVLEEARHYWAHPAAYLEGKLVGGQAGRTLCESALAFYRRQDWKCPERAVAIEVPAVALLTSE